jgi:hypothetical protein
LSVTCSVPFERLAVPIKEAFRPLRTVGFPWASSGGHAAAHAPLHALFVPESASNRHTVRLVELTRIDPSPVFARLTVAGVAWVVFGGVAAVAALPPPLPPQAATAKAMSGTAAALARDAIGLVRVMLTP